MKGTDIIVQTAFLLNKSYGLTIETVLVGYKFPLKAYLFGGSFLWAMVTHQSKHDSLSEIKISARGSPGSQGSQCETIMNGIPDVPTWHPFIASDWFTDGSWQVHTCWLAKNPRSGHGQCMVLTSDSWGVNRQMSTLKQLQIQSDVMENEKI